MIVYLNNACEFKFQPDVESLFEEKLEYEDYNNRMNMENLEVERD